MIAIPSKGRFARLVSSPASGRPQKMLRPAASGIPAARFARQFLHTQTPENRVIGLNASIELHFPLTYC
jgi:hypothetical protein